MKGLKKQPLPDDVGASHEQSLLGGGQSMSTERPAKRRTNEIAEVEPLPIDIECKKQKHDDSIEYEEDNTFLEMVKANYLIREGMIKHLGLTIAFASFTVFSGQKTLVRYHVSQFQYI